MIHESIVPPGVRLAQFERMTRRFARPEVELVIELLIARLDAIDGDPDFEVTDAEDDFGPRPVAVGAGCPIADPDGPAHGENEDDEPDAPEERLAHRDRIRRTRCTQHRWSARQRSGAMRYGNHLLRA